MEEEKDKNQPENAEAGDGGGEGKIKKKRSVFGIVINIVIVLLVIILAFEIYFVNTYQGIYVVGDSMLYTLNGAVDEDTAGGDYVFVNKRASPDYSDIVVVDTMGYIVDVDEKYVIKRVVALGGDTIYMEAGQLYLKKSGEEQFTAVDESYVSAENCTTSSEKNSFGEHTVADGCMYLLGDNRDYSADSRLYGDCELSCLIGVVTWWSMSFKSAITSFYTTFNF